MAIRVHAPEFAQGPAGQGDRPLPTVIFLHGCSGYREGAYQAAYPRALARAGFAVFIPDSFARPDRVQACGNVRIDTVDLRRAEVRETVRRLRRIPWVDQRNLFLAGHSEGGIATAMYDGGEFNAYFIAGWTCRSTNPEFDRIHAPTSKPVLAVVGDSDPHHMHANQGHCGESFGLFRNRQSRSIVLKGFGHEVSEQPDTIPTLIKFFQANIRQ